MIWLVVSIKKLKLLLVALVLHAAARPQADTCAWTLHLESAGMNLFGVVENPTGHVTGQVFTENIRPVGGNVLHAELAGPGGLRRRSSVDFKGETGVFWELRQVIVGDRIVMIDGAELADQNDMVRRLSAAGKQLTIVVDRRGRLTQLELDDDAA